MLYFLLFSPFWSTLGYLWVYLLISEKKAVLLQTLWEEFWEMSLEIAHFQSVGNAGAASSRNTFIGKSRTSVEVNMADELKLKVTPWNITKQHSCLFSIEINWGLDYTATLMQHEHKIVLEGTAIAHPQLFIPTEVLVPSLLKMDDRFIGRKT